MLTITNDVITLSEFTSTMMYGRVFPDNVNRQSIFSGTKLKAVNVLDRSGSHAIAFNKVEFRDNPFEGMYGDSNAKVNYTNKVVEKGDTQYELANVTIQKGMGNILTVGESVETTSDWHYDNIMQTIDANLAEAFYKACAYRAVVGIDLVHLKGIKQTPDQKADPKKNLSSFYDIATDPAAIGLTATITKGDLDGLEKITSEIRNYFSFSNVLSGSPNISNLNDVLILISSDILRATFKQFNAGSAPYMTMESFVKEQLPEVQIVPCDLIKNTMLVIEQNYSTLLYGQLLAISAFQRDQDIVNFRVKNTIGSVICEDPTKVILYKDFMTDPALMNASMQKQSASDIELKALKKKYTEMERKNEQLEGKINNLIEKTVIK